MSPEQASGQISMIDRRSDVWSLGIMLDEMLTARRPFSGSVIEVLTAVQNQPIQPLRTVDPSLPIDLETICLKALERDIDKRFQTAGQMSDELERWQRGEPITLRRISLSERVWRWAKRNQTVAALLATVFATLVVGSIVSTWFGIDATRAVRQLREERDARSRVQVQSILRAESGAVSALLAELEQMRGDEALLEHIRSINTGNADDATATRRSLIQMHMTDNPAEYLRAVKDVERSLLQSQPGEFLMIRQELLGEKDSLVSDLWEKLENPSERKLPPEVGTVGSTESCPVEEGEPPVCDVVGWESSGWDTLGCDTLGWDTLGRVTVGVDGCCADESTAASCPT